ncbi:MAG TPA: alanine--tRNA ligase [Pyrinomonadaceae bacterium]|nr:alanine--tRNA ligase [Pyrinomonadaceae bacterium]
MMTGNEIREIFLSYFERNGHTRVRSSPLLPANDPTLLFTNAGMNQFKDVFLGQEQRAYTRAVSSQKCIRAGGKHNDLDEVGKTARHHTFFEMLGNFSFGDYFKEDAIRYAWDLLVNEYKLDPARLWFSVYEGDEEVPADEEAAALWEQVGAPPERILRFGRKDNFWQMGDTGPCGPCSEIHYYMGDDPEDPSKNRPEFVNGPGDTTMEIWNLVFMQFNRIGEGERDPQTGKYSTYRLEPLPKPSVDTGMGLERVAAVLQGQTSNYGTDLIRPIIEFTAKLADRHYEPDTQEGFAMRVIADHARSTAFSIADGILPGNEGRNYVLRKIMRRAIYQGRNTLGFDGLFFNEVCNFVADQMHDAFPELEAQRGFIEKMVRFEEERFGATLTVGLKKLEELIKVSSEDKGVAYIPTIELAKLYDTFGTPIDLMYVILAQGKHKIMNQLITHDGVSSKVIENLIEGFHRGPREGVKSVEELTEDDFRKDVENLLKELQQSGTERHAAENKKAKPVYVALSRRTDTRSEFKGYETTSVEESKIIALLKGEDEVQSLNEDEEGEAVLHHTPFYAESGGQVGDVGVFVGEHASASVVDTYSPAQGLIVHKVKVERGSLKVGDTVSARVDVEKRDATRRNHTATHLMHAALREVLGTHVKQAGSVVAPNYLRFDFTHFQPLSREEIGEIERLVNYHILRNEQVGTEELALEEAMQSGAMALFGEKYAEKVRVLSVAGVGGDAFSKELCGGTHVRSTGDIGLFKIVSDESIASGTRRIRAVTGWDALTRFRETEALVDQVAGSLRSTRGDLPATVERLQEELKRARRTNEELKQKLASGAGGGASSAGNGNDVREVAGVRVLAREASELDAAGLRQLSDTLLARVKSGVVVLGRQGDGKASIIVRTSKDLHGRVPAGQVVRELAVIIGGRGGGKPDMAEGGGAQVEKLAEALEASYEVIGRLLGANGV